MSSLFDDSFLADLQPTRRRSTRRRPRTTRPRSRFRTISSAGAFDVPPARDAVLPRRRPAPGRRPRRAARGAERAAARRRRARRRRRCSSWPAPARARPGCSPTASPTCSATRERAPRPDPRDHLHQQGRRRDEGARRAARRPARQGDVGHRPSTARACASCAASRKKLGFTSSFSIYDAADSKRLMALVCRDLDLDPKRFPPKSFSAKISNLKNELIDEETFADQAADGFEKTLAEAYAHVPGAAARGQRPGLRRHHHDDGQPAPGLPGRRRALPPPLPARPGRRVPGHQPRPVHAGARAGRAPGRTGERPAARRAVRGRRRRPVDLRLPRRDHPQHPPVRGGLPGRDDDPAGAELPLHADDPLRRQRGHRAQREPPPQEPVDRRRARARRSPATSPTPSTTRRSSSPTRSTG